ncbi:MFS transporter [Leekyejoonella antrihumi]|uniref:Multidrug efflux MFS transporter n=1 Tax=Leekyejoonella antrihumi TaxID=1660198 RepID=A0A563DTM5_9MICO|nr:MFS transporter [Leekyejoonella antrihumi]TWP33529.1 multidrug efflux MFS transporter [Leekyejoonella antrihumi]
MGTAGRGTAVSHPTMRVEHDTGDTGALGVAARDNRPVRRGLIFTTIALALMMMSVDSTIVATALRSLQHGLGTSINWAGWTLTAYSFGFILMLPVTGKLSERLGRRRVFLASVATFTIASLCCGAATNIYVLIALRAVQAGAGAGFTPSATGIIVDHFGDARDRAVGLFGSIFPVGAMIGPIFGGLFVTYWTWRGVFLVNVPVGLVVVVLALRYIPRDHAQPGRSRGGLDATGMSLLGIGLLAGMLAASYLGETGARPLSAPFIAPLLVALAALSTFFRHLGRSSHPFIAPHLIHGPGFGPVNLINVVYGGITQGVIVLLPLYAANRYGISALGSGLLLIAQGIAAVALSTIVAFTLRRTGYRPPLLVGSVLIIAGVVLLATRPLGGITSFAWLAGAAFLVGVGGGTINPPCRNAGLQLAPQHAATLAALRSMSLQLGSIVTVSIATALLAGSGSPGIVQAWFYLATAIVLLVGLPLIARVPEHRGTW